MSYLISFAFFSDNCFKVGIFLVLRMIISLFVGFDLLPKLRAKNFNVIKLKVVHQIFVFFDIKNDNMAHFLCSDLFSKL